MDFNKKAAELFQSYPAAKSFHFTRDGFAFERLTDAEGHAGSLKDREITEVTRGAVIIATAKESVKARAEAKTAADATADGEADKKPAPAEGVTGSETPARADGKPAKKAAGRPGKKADAAGDSEAGTEQK